MRVVSAATAILLISSEPISDVVGLALFVAIVLFQRVRGKREALKAAYMGLPPEMPAAAKEARATGGVRLANMAK